MTRLIVVGSAAAFALALGALLVAAMLSLPLPREPLAPLVLAELPSSGASHPVTAVLLDFRAYDTLLELVVLLIAVLAVRALPSEPRTVHAPPPPLLAAFARRLLPLIVIVAAYLLWRGSTGPGGAFHAGALAAAGAVLASLAGAPFAIRAPHFAPLAVAGVAVFAAVGASSLAAGRAFLQYPPGLAGPLILAIECAAAVSIAVTLALLFDPEAAR